MAPRPASRDGAMNGLKGWCAVLDVRPHGESPVSPPGAPLTPPHARVHGSRPFPSPDASGGWLLPAGVLRWGRGGGGSREASLVEWGCAHPPPGIAAPAYARARPAAVGRFEGLWGPCGPSLPRRAWGAPSCQGPQPSHSRDRCWAGPRAFR